MKKCAEAKKKNCRQTRKRKEEGFFDHPFFCPFLSKSKSSSKSARSLNSCTLKHRFFSSFCASSFFFLLARSIHSSHFSLVARARVYTYLETRDLDAFHSRDETRKRERRKENDVHERRRSRRKKGRGRKKDRIVFSEQRSFE